MSQLAFCSENTPAAALAALERYGKTVVPLPPHPALPQPVSRHADMIFTKIGDAVFFDKIYASAHPGVIRAVEKYTRCTVVITAETAGGEYPDDCLFNVLVGDSFAVGRRASLSNGVLGALTFSGRKLIDVKQGYAACSCLLAGGVVTADGGIADALEGVCEVLRIASGGIDLPPYDTGFIGGASGVDAKNVYFVGDLATHPDGAAIEKFLNSRSYTAVSLMSGALTDVGGVRFIDIE